MWKEVVCGWRMGESRLAFQRMVLVELLFIKQVGLAGWVNKELMKSGLV